MLIELLINMPFIEEGMSMPYETGVRAPSLAYTCIIVSIACIILFSLSSCSVAGKPEANTSTDEVPALQQAQEYNLESIVTCEENFIFSRYDVDIYIDGNIVFTLDHGTERSITLSLPEGMHTFKAAKTDDKSVDGSMDFDMPAEESILSCQISCNSDQVKIKSFSVKTKTQAAEDEAAAKREQEEKEAAAAAQAEQEAAEAAAKAEQEAKDKDEAEQKAKEKAAQEQAEKEAEEAGPVTSSTAKLAVSRYGKSVYPHGFKLHYIIDTRNEERQPDGSLFLKMSCEVKNAYGTWIKDLMCEATVGGTEGDPEVLSFNVY